MKIRLTRRQQEAMMIDNELTTPEELDAHLERLNVKNEKDGIGIEYERVTAVSSKTRDFETLKYRDTAFLDDDQEKKFKSLYNKLVHFEGFKEGFTALAMLRYANPE